ncbi:hypothetical protein SAMN04487948_103164 [Halogranum amylolyticum]|uniref:BNR/Asp-box repeat-containing protein n=1 Tax=Halogranum amylolyticum TaxID=660520 RepID=A0A1H8QKM3_9EURY|nr:glycosyl hydrolase [Halogranum amylolyticum]SEO54566.1 hypothetical protein SAMN04487948_103164 [Halogranum amylolyticum]
MLIAGSDDGVYSVADVDDPDATTEKVLDAGRVFRVERFDALSGLFAASTTGLYHSLDGTDWTAVPLPVDEAYAVAADPAGSRLYVGTRPSRLLVADCNAGVPTVERAWRPISAFDDLREESDWGLPRHDGVSQVRSVCTHSSAPDRLAVGVEVGGVHVSDDRGITWTDRSIRGFDAPHTDDVHHLTLADGETLVASTGSGLYRSPDLGETWTRLDTDHSQRYFREAFAHDDVVYAGAAPGPSPTWDDGGHALFECHDGETLNEVASPTPDEHAIGWCATDEDVLAVTHRGTLLRRRRGDWKAVGTVPTPGDLRGRYLPLTWYER